MDLIHSLKTLRAGGFNPDGLFVEVWEYVSLVPLDLSSYPCQRIKMIFTTIEWSGNMGDYLLYYQIIK